MSRKIDQKIAKIHEDLAKVTKAISAATAAWAEAVRAAQAPLPSGKKAKAAAKKRAKAIANRLKRRQGLLRRAQQLRVLLEGLEKEKKEKQEAEAARAECYEDAHAIQFPETNTATGWDRIQGGGGGEEGEGEDGALMGFKNAIDYAYSLRQEEPTLPTQEVSYVDIENINFSQDTVTAATKGWKYEGDGKTRQTREYCRSKIARKFPIKIYIRREAEGSINMYLTGYWGASDFKFPDAKIIIGKSTPDAYTQCINGYYLDETSLNNCSMALKEKYGQSPTWNKAHKQWELEYHKYPNYMPLIELVDFEDNKKYVTINNRRLFTIYQLLCCVLNENVGFQNTCYQIKGKETCSQLRNWKHNFKVALANAGFDPTDTNIRIFIPCLIKRSQDNPPPWLRNQEIVVTRECEPIEKKRRALMDKKAAPECPAACLKDAVEANPEAIVTLSRDAQRAAAGREGEEEAPEDVALSRLSNKRWASAKVLMEGVAQRSAREEATQNPRGEEPPLSEAPKKKKNKKVAEMVKAPSNTWDSFLFDRFMLQPTFNLKDYYRGTDLLPNDSGDGKKKGQGPLSVIGTSTCGAEREGEVVQFRELGAYDDLMRQLTNADNTGERTFDQLTNSKLLIVSNVLGIQEMFEDEDAAAAQADPGAAAQADPGAAAQADPPPGHTAFSWRAGSSEARIPAGHTAFSYGQPSASATRGGRRSRRRRRRQQQTKRSSNSRKKRKTRRKRRRRRRRKTKRHSRY